MDASVPYVLMADIDTSAHRRQDARVLVCMAVICYTHAYKHACMHTHIRVITQLWGPK